MFMQTVPEYPPSPESHAEPNAPPLKQSPQIHAAARTLTRALRSSNRLCFFNRMTLKRSKSVSDWRRSCWSCFLAQLPSCHFASIPAASHAFLTVPDRAPRGSLSTTIGVRRVLASETMPRGVASRGSEEGPSTRAWNTSFSPFPFHIFTRVS